jgi:tRNA/rRNA methyltransferase
VPASISVVLVSPRNPLNIGAAARAMSNFGFTDLRLVNPYDVAFREARSAVKSEYILEQARVFETVAEAITDCTLVIGGTSVGHRDLHLPLYRLEPAGQLVRDSSTAVAILFGSEKFGLSNEDMSHCHWLYRIPAREEHGSMNLGQAVAITLYELIRDREAESQRFEPAPRAEAADFERILTLLYQILNQSGYIQERMAEPEKIRLRNLINRLAIPAPDAKTWQGILRQIQWKINHPEMG